MGRGTRLLIMTTLSHCLYKQSELYFPNKNTFKSIHEPDSNCKIHDEFNCKNCISLSLEEGEKMYIRLKEQNNHE